MPNVILCLRGLRTAEPSHDRWLSSSFLVSYELLEIDRFVKRYTNFYGQIC